VAVSGIALAHTHRWNTTITFNSAANDPFGPKAYYKGNVNSGKPACKKHREVQIFRVGNPDVRLGRGFSLANGTWKIKGNRPANGAEIYALVEAKALPLAGHNHSCAEAFSAHLKYPHP
jgi:hypothetical protein